MDLLLPLQVYILQNQASVVLRVHVEFKYCLNTKQRMLSHLSCKYLKLITMHIDTDIFSISSLFESSK